MFWSSIKADGLAQLPLTASARLTIDFPEIDWLSLRSTYGWSALQYQAWARGSLVVKGVAKQTLLLNTDNVSEFWINNKPYFGGDFYAYRNAPLVLQLDPGYHKIELRLIRDVRAMGGDGEPTIQVELDVQRSEGNLALDGKKLVVSDIVDGKLVSSLACVPVRNESARWIDVWEVKPVVVSLWPSIPSRQ